MNVNKKYTDCFKPGNDHRYYLEDNITTSGNILDLNLGASKPVSCPRSEAKFLSPSPSCWCVRIPS